MRAGASCISTCSATFILSKSALRLSACFATSNARPAMRADTTAIALDVFSAPVIAICASDVRHTDQASPAPSYSRPDLAPVSRRYRGQAQLLEYPQVHPRICPDVSGTLLEDS